jgi:hypothetical protein
VRGKERAVSRWKSIEVVQCAGDTALVKPAEKNEEHCIKDEPQRERDHPPPGGGRRVMSLLMFCGGWGGGG